MVHMCTMLDEYIESTGEDSSSGPKGAAGVAAKADVKKLVLTHLGASFDDPEIAGKTLTALKVIFKGTVIIGEDLMELPVL